MLLIIVGCRADVVNVDEWTALTKVGSLAIVGSHVCNLQTLPGECGRPWSLDRLSPGSTHWAALAGVRTCIDASSSDVHNGIPPSPMIWTLKACSKGAVCCPLRSHWGETI